MGAATTFGGFQPRERGLEEIEFPRLVDETPCLSFEAIVVIPRAFDEMMGTEFIHAAVRALGSHDLGPTSWVAGRFPDPGGEIQIDALPWRLPPEIHGMWRERRVELEIRTWIDAEKHSATFYIDWEWREPGVLIEPLIAWMLEVRGLAGERAYIAEVAYLEPAMKLLHRPPRVSVDFGRGVLRGTLLDFVDTTARSWSAGLPRGLERMLPERTQRQVAGPVQVLRWARDPLTLEEIQRAVLAREYWVATALQTEQDDRWNDRGDHRCEYTYDCRAHPPLARYCGNLARGFIEVDRDVADARLDELAAWCARGRLPDGTPIAKLDALCPDRESAVALHPRLHARGLGSTYDDDEIWDPFPEGYVCALPEVPPHLELVLTCDVSQEDLRLVQQILEHLDERGIGASHWRVRSDTAPDELHELETLAWPTFEVELVGEPQEPSISVLARASCIEIRVRWPWRDGMRLMAPLADALVDWRGKLPEGMRFASATLTLRGLPLRSLHRPPELGRRTYGALLEGIDDGKLHQWAVDPLTLDEVQRAWTAQQRWVRESVATELSWNELGDLLVRGELETTPQFTLFDAETGAGYRAIYVEPDGTLEDDTAFKAMARIRARGVLGDGTAITRITLVCPTREAALALEARARTHRLGVAYARDQGEIWIVHPEGWVDEG